MEISKLALGEAAISGEYESTAAILEGCLIMLKVRETDTPLNDIHEHLRVYYE
jgi:hypothetical protein